jgi:hypothetical protein
VLKALVASLLMVGCASTPDLPPPSLEDQCRASYKHFVEFDTCTSQIRGCIVSLDEFRVAEQHRQFLNAFCVLKEEPNVQNDPPQAEPPTIRPDGSPQALQREEGEDRPGGSDSPQDQRRDQGLPEARLVERQVTALLPIIIIDRRKKA